MKINKHYAKTSFFLFSMGTQKALLLVMEYTIFKNVLKDQKEIRQIFSCMSLIMLSILHLAFQTWGFRILKQKHIKQNMVFIIN